MKKLKNVLWVALVLGAAVPVIGPHLVGDNSGSQPDSRLLMGTLTDARPQAKWVSITGQPQDIAVIDVRQDKAQNPTTYFKMPGFYHQPVMAGTRPCSRVTMPGHIQLQSEGLPEVPVVSQSIQVPAGSTTTLKLISHETRTYKVDPVEPSLGHLTRDQNPALMIPDFNEFYHSNEIYPKAPAELGKHFTLREYSGVNLRIYPLRYDAGKDLLIVTEKLVMDVVIEETDGTIKSVTMEYGGGREFDTVYQNVFGENLPPLATDKYNALPDRGRMLIISHDSLADNLGDFVAWKQQLGIDVTVRTTSEVGGTNTGIQTAIRDMFGEAAGLTWVILVGDIQQVPTNPGGFDGSDSDSRYGMLLGDDLYPEIYLSRISATNSTQLLTQLNKFINYEKNPTGSQDSQWYRTGLGVASSEGDPTDAERAELLAEDLLEYGFLDVQGVYEDQGGHSTMITNAVNQGVSVINYLGHGSGTSWASVYFSNTQVYQLDNGPHWPWIIDVSCSNGNFALDECLAEAWLRAGTPAEPQGAIGMISASSLAPWVPPTVMQTEVIDLLTTESTFTLGGLYYSGLMKVLDEYTGVSVAEQVIDQNVIFGDCSLMVRTAEPALFQVQGPEDLDSTDLLWEGQITGPAGSMATLTWDGVLLGCAQISDSGLTSIEMMDGLGDATQLILTVSGFNMVPHQQILSIDGGEILTPEPEEEPEPVISVPTEVLLRGNFPNPFNPSTTIAFDLPREMRVRLAVYDIRGHLVQQLVDENLGAGPREILWNGTDSRGGNVSSGVYLYRLDTADGTKTGRMTLSK